MHDSELAKMIYVEKTPTTTEGKQILTAIVKQCDLHGFEPSHVNSLHGKVSSMQKSESFSSRTRSGHQALWPAAFNEVLAFKSDILGLPNNKKWKKLLKMTPQGQA